MEKKKTLKVNESVQKKSDITLEDNTNGNIQLTPDLLRCYFNTIKRIKEEKGKSELDIDDLKDCDDIVVQKLIFENNWPVYGKKIKLVRGVLGMTTTRMSVDLGYNSTFLKFAETGYNKVRQYFFKYFSMAYGVDYNWLIDDSEKSLLVEEIPVGLTQQIKLEFDKLDENYQAFAVSALRALNKLQKREEERIDREVNNRLKEFVKALENDSNIDKKCLHEVIKLMPGNLYNDDYPIFIEEDE